MTDENIEFYPSRSHVVVLLLVAVGLVLACGIAVRLGFSSAQSGETSSALFVVSAGAVGVFIFGGIALLALRRLFLPRWPVLTLDGEGFIDWLPNIGVEQVAWSEVKGSRTANLVGRRVLAVDVTDPGAIVQRQRTLLRRVVAAVNIRLVGTPVILKPGSVRGSMDNLKSALDSYTIPSHTPAPIRSTTSG